MNMEHVRIEFQENAFHNGMLCGTLVFQTINDRGIPRMNEKCFATVTAEEKQLISLESNDELPIALRGSEVQQAVACMLSVLFDKRINGVPHVWVRA